MKFFIMISKPIPVGKPIEVEINDPPPRIERLWALGELAQPYGILIYNEEEWREFQEGENGT